MTQHFSNFLIPKNLPPTGTGILPNIHWQMKLNDIDDDFDFMKLFFPYINTNTHIYKYAHIVFMCVHAFLQKHAYISLKILKHSAHKVSQFDKYD